MKFRELFSDGPVNTERQIELDFGKALPVLCLPFVHCFIECTPSEGLDHGIPFLFDYVIGSPISAPMFVFCMGVCIAYTKKNSASDLAKRAGKLFLIGMLLNICRFLFPYLIGYAITGEAGKYLEPLLYRVLGNDILQFASLSFLCIALFVKLKIPDVIMLLLSFGASLIGWGFNDVDLGNSAANVILGHFIGTEDAAGLVISDFPLLNWLIVPVAGYVFGRLLLRVRDKDAFYLRIFPIPLVLSVSFLIVEYFLGIGMNRPGGENTYYHATTYDVIAFIALTVGLLGVYRFVGKIMPEKIRAFLTGVSRGITSIYCIHWVFVVLITNVLLYVVRGTQELPVWQTLVLSFAILVISLILSQLWRKYKKGKAQHEKA